MLRLLLFFLLSSVATQAADPVSAASPPYFSVRYEVSGKAGDLTMPVTYTLWVPKGVKVLRGIIVHQHGCGIPAAATGLTAAYDLHWQALAKKWDCALLGPSYHQLSSKDCRQWCDPRNGSDKAFQTALQDFAKQSGHSELTSVPWCLWGHSGGGFWSSLMLTLHPERIAAIFFRSGSAYAVWQRGEIPAPTLSPEVYQVPFMFIGGAREVGDKSHGPARVGDRAMLQWWRANGAPGGLATDPLSGHDCGDSRYLAIPFFDACLAQRLPAVGAGDRSLRPVNFDKAWYATSVATKAQSAETFQENKLEAYWLPDEAFARIWESYCYTGRPADTTPPAAPTEVIVSDQGEVSWDAEADFESGLAGFIIQRDGKELARLPEIAPAAKYGTPLFQGLSHGDTPTAAVTLMKYRDLSAKAGENHQYRVLSVNGVGLVSEAGGVDGRK